MPLPVTVWLAGAAGPGPLVGLTVSSVLLAQGQPPLLGGLVGPLTDLAEAISGAGAAFVVHVLADGHQRLAKHFSGELPAPADLLAAEPSPHGPLLKVVSERLLCRTRASQEFGWSLFVEAEIEHVTPPAPAAGLAWYRGDFVRLPDRR
jgi:flavin reductase (DIM6/NTAB) family NADH-FMN oxidoreductase RutF